MKKTHFLVRPLNKKATITRHMSIHTSEKPHSHEVCENAVTDLSTLTHFFFQTGSELFSCGACEKSYAFEGNLKKL